jgi:hypothetical protein
MSDPFEIPRGTICPILEVARRASDDDWYNAYCLGDECKWWNEAANTCVVAALGHPAPGQETKETDNA